jgi:hypothetical protein
LAHQALALMQQACGCDAQLLAAVKALFPVTYPLVVEHMFFHRRARITKAAADADHSFIDIHLPWDSASLSQTHAQYANFQLECGSECGRMCVTDATIRPSVVLESGMCSNYLEALRYRAMMIKSDCATC